MLPDGTVMVGDKVVVGIQGLPRAAATADEEAEEAARERERAADARLRAVEEKIAQLLGVQTPREDHFSLHDEASSSSASTHNTSERTTEKTMERTETTTETKEKTAINPRTGRPLTIPAPLSQSSQPGTTVKETIEEVSLSTFLPS
jgi:hypothetical protein